LLFYVANCAITLIWENALTNRAPSKYPRLSGLKHPLLILIGVRIRLDNNRQGFIVYGRTALCFRFSSYVKTYNSKNNKQDGGRLEPGHRFLEHHIADHRDSGCT